MSDNIIFGDEMNIKYDKIGIRLAKRRKELKYTQPQLAEIVGISKNHISQFENGGSVSLEVLLDLCEALKITPDYLLLGTIRDTPSEDFIDLIKLCDDYEISVLICKEVTFLLIAICDDDSNFIKNVKEHLSFYSGEHNTDFEVHTFSDSKDLIDSNIKYNIAILDVEMPGCNGIEVGKILRERNRHIVLMYITSHKKYLDEALNLNAARFFEKPIDSKRFYDGFDNALKRIDNTTIKFFLKENNAAVRINANNIIYIEIEPIGHRKTKVVTENKIYISSNKMAFWEEHLISSLFVKTHKSYIVNMEYLTKYENDTIQLDYKYNLPISRNYQSAVHKAFIRYMTGM